MHIYNLSMNLNRLHREIKFSTLKIITYLMISIEIP